MACLKRLALYVGVLIGTTVAQSALASVVMSGTRVIYPAAVREKALQLTSHDAYPNLVQIWVDKGNPASTPETADAPFIASPQIFRMNPKAGQMVRLVYTGKDLPQDRESVFFINFMQMPALKASDMEANKLMLTVSSRMKVFYRPESIVGNPQDIAKNMTFSLQGSGSNMTVSAENKSGYHAVVREANLLVGGKSVNVAKAVMVAPFSTAQWPVVASTANSGKDQLRLTLVNDYGADVTTDLPLQ